MAFFSNTSYGNTNPFTVSGSNTTSPTSDNTGLAITPQGTGGATGSLSGSLSAASIQMFRTVPLPNRLVNLFSLHCFNNSKLSKSAVSSGPSARNITNTYNVSNNIFYNFPISPSGYVVNINAVTTKYIIKGGNGSTPGRVDNVFDKYGYTPPSFLIEGTTGWKYHTLDGGLYSGYQSFHNLQKIIKYYFNKNANIINKSDKYILALYDYYNQIYWEVEPMGPQTFSMSENAPLNGYYRLFFEGVRNISDPPSTIQLTSVLDQMIANIAVSAVNTATSLAAPFVGVANDVGNIGSPLGT